MTKLIWKRSHRGNSVLKFWQLKTIVFPSRDGWNYNVLGLETGVAWGPGFRTEAEARAAAEKAFLEHKHAHDWATPGRQAWEEWLDSPSATAEEQDEKEMSRPRQVDLCPPRSRGRHETERAVHFDGCSYKDEHCHSDRCECWGAGYWVPKSKLFFDQDEKVWYIDRAFAEEHDIDVSEDEYEG